MAGARGYLASRLHDKLRAACIAYGLDFIMSWEGGAWGANLVGEAADCFVFMRRAKGEYPRRASL